MWRNFTLILGLACIIAAGQTVFAQESEPPMIDCRIISSAESVSPGETLKLGVLFKIPQGMHIYFREPGDSGRATSVEFELRDSASVSELAWPRPERIVNEGLVSYGYHKELVLAASAKFDQKLENKSIQIRAKVSWLLCGNGSCIPGETELSLDLPVSSFAGKPSAEAALLAFKNFTGSLAELDKSRPAEQDHPATKEAAANTGLSLPYALTLAFLAGLLLNLMPCVLPVIALKVLSFTKQAGQKRSQSLRLGLAYTAGTLLTFAALASAIVCARALGTQLGWGFQFQSLSYLVGMASIICLMTLSLFGMFYVQIQTGVQSLENAAAKSDGMASAFARGISATLLSTPCSAPLLGTALGFAMSQPGPWVFAVLLAVGMGLSFPYLLLSYFPGWLKFLPKPGVWMERFKEAMGFLMLGTLVWMLSVIGKVGGTAALTGTLSFLFCLVISTWIYTRFAAGRTSWLRRVIVAGLALLLAGSAFYTQVWTLPENSVQNEQSLQLNGITVEKYSQEAVQKYLGENRIVFLDVTAEWCLSCKLNEKVLSMSSVQELMRKHNVVVLQADWTRGQEEVGTLIRSFGRPGVPMYVIYSPGKEPVLLPELITPGIVTDAIDRAAR